MKKVYFIAALFFGLSGSVSAVAASTAPGDGPTIQQRAVALTRSMATKMRLDEGQYLKLKQLNLRWLTEMEKMKESGTATASALDEHTAAMQSQYQSELMSLLHPAQQQLYRQLENSRVAFLAE